MANNIDKWHGKNIVDHGFENDDDFEELKTSPNKFEKTQVIDDDDLAFLRKGTFKIFQPNPRNFSFRGNDQGSPRKRASKKNAAAARGQKYQTMNESNRDSSRKKITKVGSQNNFTE